MTAREERRQDDKALRAKILRERKRASGRERQRTSERQRAGERKAEREKDREREKEIGW